MSTSPVRVVITADVRPYLRALRKMFAPLLWEGDQA